MSMNKSGLPQMQLGQLMDIMTSSDRMKIFDGTDEKTAKLLYKGFVACMEYEKENIDLTRRVARVGLGVDIFRKDQPNCQFNTMQYIQQLAEEVPVESISEYKYSDLQENIYTRIFLEVTADETE